MPATSKEDNQRTDMYDLEEQEQIDALKAWWRQNGRLVVVAVVAAAVAALATAGWRYYRAKANEQASQVFAALEKAARGNDAKQVRDLAQQLMDQYGSTAYAAMGALVVAKASFEAGDLAAAGRELEWAAEHARDEETKALARLRLAGVRLDEKKYDEALELLEQPPESFVPLYADLKGDVLAAQGKAPEARAAYQSALDKLPAEGLFRAIVQVKLDGLGPAQP
jgi:predicted negative regulator of RcsB-dependent stress response